MSSDDRLNGLRRLRALATAAGDAEALALLAELIAGTPVLTPGARRRALLDARDELLRATAARYFPHLSVSRQAHFLALHLSHYRAGAWAAGDSALAESPSHYAGQIEGALWLVLRLIDAPLSSEHVRRILGISRPFHAQLLDTGALKRNGADDPSET